MNEILLGDSIALMKELESDFVHSIISDIPYGIGCDYWDVFHDNKNSALLGTSKAQIKAGNVFKHRGKPLNGWSEADKKISREYQSWCESWAEEWLRVLKPGASTFIFAGRRMAHRCICAMEDAGFIFKDMIAWEKEQAHHRAQLIEIIFDRRGDFDNAKKWHDWRVGNLRPIFEPVLWFMKPYKIGGTLADNVRDYGIGAFNDEMWKKYSPNSANTLKIKSYQDDYGLHPAQKPLNILKALIELVTIKGQIVLDPFCGSGSTLVAAKQLERKFLGFESDKNFFEIAKKRLDKVEIQSTLNLSN